MNDNNETKKTINLSLIGAFIAGLCCFSPLVLFLAGLSTASFAGSLADIFYYQYKWYFRLAGIIFLAWSFFLWYKQKAKTCNIDEKKRLRKKMTNLFLISIIVFILAYIIWLYVIVEFLGIKLGLWQIPKSLKGVF